jgi:hypothetical protein
LLCCSFPLIVVLPGNIGHTRYRRTSIKAKEQHSKQKGKSIIENPETQATLSTRRNEDKQLTVPSVCCVVPLFSLSSFCILCSQCCLYLWILYNWLSLLFALWFFCFDCRLYLVLCAQCCQ